MLAISANGTTVYAEWEDNSSAAAFADLLREGLVSVNAHDYGSFEKVDMRRGTGRCLVVTDR